MKLSLFNEKRCGCLGFWISYPIVLKTLIIGFDYGKGSFGISIRFSKKDFMEK